MKKIESIDLKNSKLNKMNSYKTIKRLCLLFIIIGMIGTACNQPKNYNIESESKESTALKDPFFGLQPEATAQILGPEIISTSMVEYNGTFSPDGKHFIYTAEVNNKGHLVSMKMKENGTWAEPEIAEFSGLHSEYDPLFSPNGNQLLFSSERSIDEESEPGLTNIWLQNKTESGWSSPSPVNLTGNGDFYSSMTNDGIIYFNVWNKGKIYRALPTDTGYIVEKLPKIINSRSDVGDPFIAPDESYLIFRAYYNEGFGRGDLYISFRFNNTWTNPENLGEPINSNAHEICPTVSSDGKIFLFSSNRMIKNYPNSDLNQLKKKQLSYDNGNSNIFYISTDFIEKLKAKHLLN